MSNHWQKAYRLQKEIERYQATGVFHRYSPIFPRVLLTDGMLHLCTHGECFWLADCIASLQQHRKVRECEQLKEHCQFWIVEKDCRDVTTLICTWDKNKIVLKEEIGITDFLLTEARIWVNKTWLSPDAGRDDWFWLFFLPSEY